MDPETVEVLWLMALGSGIGMIAGAFFGVWMVVPGLVLMVGAVAFDAWSD